MCQTQSLCWIDVPRAERKNITKYTNNFRYQEKESIEEELKKEIKQYQDQLSNVNSELKTQKAKNDVSFTKNLTTNHLVIWLGFYAIL